MERIVLDLDELKDKLEAIENDGYSLVGIEIDDSSNFREAKITGLGIDESDSTEYGTLDEASCILD